MFEYPQRKIYLYTIPTIKGDVVLKFKQATAEETMDHEEILRKLIEAAKNGDKNEYDSINMVFTNNLWEFIEKHVVGFNKKHFYVTKRQLLSYIKGDLDKYSKEIYGLLHLIRKSVYSDLPVPLTPEEAKKGRRKCLFQNNLETISKHTLIPVDQIMQRLTIEQVGWWHDKLTFDYYETFDEGKKVNTKVKLNKGLDQDQKELLDYIKNQRKQTKEDV